MNKRNWMIAVMVTVPALAVAGPIDHRQEMMEDTRDALKVMLGMSKGETEFDNEAVMESLKVMHRTATQVGQYFPEGSESGQDTEAKSTIWTDREGFDQAMANFDTAVNDAMAADPASVDELKPVLNGILKTCKGCHDDYRIEKD